ncbi:topology modulation protein [Planococcus sp. FY231025]|uniref:topology modulation protein n=1 Tax=Planococcus sp. FY231025 TaxID=3455699 RepID=UPI003F938BB2
MGRIMVVGVSAGVGKSTFARALGEELGLPVYHLDRYHWKPGWVEADKNEFREALEGLVNEDAWIIEGNYSSTIDLRLSRADTLIYLELPLRVCLYRVLKRWLTNIGRTRPDMGEGCPERMEWEFLKFIITTYGRRKTEMRQRLAAFQEMDPRYRPVLLASKEQIDGFLSGLRENRRKKEQ